MRVTVAAAGHLKALVGVVHYFGLACLNKWFGAFLVAYIDILAVLHGKRFNNLIVFGSKDLTIDHEIGLFGIVGCVVHNFVYFFGCISFMFGKNLIKTQR